MAEIVKSKDMNLALKELILESFSLLKIVDHFELSSIIIVFLLKNNMTLKLCREVKREQ